MRYFVGQTVLLWVVINTTSSPTRLIARFVMVEVISVWHGVIGKSGDTEYRNIDHKEWREVDQNTSQKGPLIESIWWWNEQQKSNLISRSINDQLWLGFHGESTCRNMQCIVPKGDVCLDLITGLYRHQTYEEFLRDRKISSAA